MKNKTAALLLSLAASLLCACSSAAVAESSKDTSQRKETAAAQSITQAEASAEQQDGAQESTSAFSEPMPNTRAAELFLQDRPERIKEIYRTLYEGMFSYTQSIELPKGVISSDDFGDLLEMVTMTGVCADAMESDYKMYVDESSCVSRIVLSYTRTREDGASEYARLMKRAKQIAADAASLDSDYAKVKYFHDTIVLGCTYTSDAPYAHTAYGALVDGNAVCEGYAKAFQLLCELSGITAVPVSGSAVDSDGLVQSHMWNKVLLDGEWYNVDCTWDDPTGSLYKDNKRYDYFLVSDGVLAISHTEDTNAYMPEPNAWDETGSYFEREGLVLGYTTDVYSELYNAAALCFAGGLPDDTIRFLCFDGELYNDIDELYFTDTDEHEARFKEILRNFMEDGEQVSYAIMSEPRTRVISVRILRDRS